MADLLIKETISGGTKVYYSVPENPCAAVFWVHGHGEHFGRYKTLAAKAAEMGIAFLGADLYGHGESEGKRGGLPKSGYSEELNRAWRHLKARIPNRLPVVACGHSMGGSVVLDFLRNSGTAFEFSAVLLSAPYLRLAFAPPRWKLVLARIMKQIMPGLTQPTGLDTAAISRSESVVNAYRSDSLVHDRMSVALFHYCESNGKHFLNSAQEFVPGKPFSIIHGDADRITDFRASQEFASARAGTRIRILPGYYHEWFRDEGGEEILLEELMFLARK
jgi:acylglycerol lipase